MQSMGSRYDRRSISPDNLSLYSQALITLRPGLAESYSSWNSRRLNAFARREESLPVPVISVGNIAFGGTGKTPVVLSLGRWLASKERKVGVVCSGHAGKIRKAGGIVSDGAHVFLDASSAGEEAVLIAHALRDLHIPVAAGAQRTALGQLLIDRYGVDTILLDDGFQFRSLHRDADLCLVDATNPFGAAGIEDFGYLREPPHALKRATAILLTKANLIPFLELPSKGTVVHRDWVMEQLEVLAPGVPVFEVPVVDVHLERAWDPPAEVPDREDAHATAEIVEVAPGAGILDAEATVSPARLLPISAIGNAEGFEATCRMAGLLFRDPVRYDDHAAFSQGDILWWNQLAAQWGYAGIVVTSKDWVKIHPLRGGLRVPCYVLTMRLEPPSWDDLGLDLHH